MNHQTCPKTVNLNLLEINHDHFPSMPSPNFRLSGGSLGYWTACNTFKRYCTPPTVIMMARFSQHEICLYINVMTNGLNTMHCLFVKSRKLFYYVSWASTFNFLSTNTLVLYVTTPSYTSRNLSLFVFLEREINNNCTATASGMFDLNHKHTTCFLENESSL